MSADMDAAVEAAARIAAWVEFDRRNRPELADDRVVGISYENYPITRADLDDISANLLATNEEWAVKVPWPKAPDFLYRGFTSEQAARDSYGKSGTLVSRRITDWKEVEG